MVKRYYKMPMVEVEKKYMPKYIKDVIGYSAIPNNENTECIIIIAATEDVHNLISSNIDVISLTKTEAEFEARKIIPDFKIENLDVKEG